MVLGRILREQHLAVGVEEEDRLGAEDRTPPVLGRRRVRDEGEDCSEEENSDAHYRSSYPWRAAAHKENAQRTARFSSFDGLKRGKRPAETFIGWPVRGFLPLRGLRRATEKVPNPTRVTG